MEEEYITECGHQNNRKYVPFAKIVEEDCQAYGNTLAQCADYLSECHRQNIWEQTGEPFHDR